MVAWMSLLRFYAIKNTIAAICVKPLSRRLTVVCRKSKYLSPYWMPTCQRITTDYYRLQNLLLKKKVPEMTEEETEKFGSMMITWTGLSFLIGGIMLGFEIEHNKHKKAKKEERQHDSHHLTHAPGSYADIHKNKNKI